MSNRKGCEFNERIKEEERVKWHKKNPSREDEELEVHHVLPIYKAQEYEVPKEAVKSQLNAIALDKPTHLEAHRHTDEDTYKVLAQGFINIWRKLL